MQQTMTRDQLLQARGRPVYGSDGSRLGEIEEIFVIAAALGVSAAAVIAAAILSSLPLSALDMTTRASGPTIHPASPSHL